MNYDPAATEHEGPCGSAFKVQFDPRQADAAETVCFWMITQRLAHPLWSQYALSVVRLRFGVPGFPNPVLKFAGATHELLVVACNPDYGPWTRANPPARDGHVGLPPFLEPVNICEQFEATDDEMLQLADLAVQGVMHGVLWPETGGAPTRVREQWLAALVKTLAHIRGEEHAP